MSTETASIRKRKCIVEHIISGFQTAKQAIDFADTIESVVAVRTGRQKFRQFVGSPDTRLAITPQWKSDSDDYMTLVCRVDASGTLWRLSRFIYDLE